MERVIESITLRGFGSYGPDPQTLLLGGRGPVAVVGLNGAGKSTAASKALVWCFFGKTAPETMGGSTSALKGKAVIGEGQRETTVTVRMRVGSDVWTIERTRTTKLADRLTVVGPSGEEPDPEAAVVQLVGTYDVFTRTVVRGQNDPWAFAEATDARKRSILDEITGATALAVKAKAAADVEKKARERAAGAALQATSLESQTTTARAEVVRLTTEQSTWEAARPGRVAQVQAEVEQVQASIVAADAADKQRTELLTQRAAILAREPAALDLTPWQTADNAAQQAARAASTKLGGAQQAFYAVASLAAGQACPTCGQAIGPQAPVAQRRAQAHADLEVVQQETTAVLAHATACSASLDGARKWAAEQRAGWLSELAGVPAPPEALNRQSLSTSLAMAQGRLRDAQTASWWGTETLARAQAQVDHLVAQVAQAHAAEAQARADAALAADVAAALSPKGAPAHLCEAILGAVETEANHWLAILSEGRLAVEFAATGVTAQGKQQEEIQTKVWVQGDNPHFRDLISFSGGERARINMAVDLGVAAALAGQRSALSLLVLDEAVVSGLDQPGKAAVLAAIHSAGVADVVVVDHDAQLSAALPRTIVAYRDPDGFSRLKEER